MNSIETNMQAPARNIAVLTDFSPCSSTALSHAIRVATFSSGKIFLIHAIEPWRYAYFPDEGEMEHQLCERARSNMLHEEEKLCDVRHETIVEQGRLWDVLQHVIESEHIELIVLGTIGMVEFHNDEVLGSTAQQVIRQAPCPVLSVGSEVVVNDSFPNFTHILFPTDLSGGAQNAVSAAWLAKRHGAHLALMHVLRAHEPPQSDEAELKQPYRCRLGDMARQSPALSYPPDCLVEFAETPASAILKAARELPADLIVMRTARRTQASTNGRVHSSLQILLQAPCPVLTIPESDGLQIANNVGPQPDGFYVGQPEAFWPSAYALQ
jgi:nucleotide-binding universal stress UspA family protein